MTQAQADLLRELLRRERHYRGCIARGEFACPETRGVELGAFTGYQARTAACLEGLGLVDVVATDDGRRIYAYLPVGPL